MSPADAAKLLDLSADASPDQVEARFLELQSMLEEKIARAPTEGLRAKYREALARAGEACDTLLTTAPTDLLPTRTRQPASAPVSIAAPAPRSVPVATDVAPHAQAKAKPARHLGFSILAFSFCATLPLLFPLVCWWRLEVTPPEEIYRADFSLKTYLERWRAAHYLGLAVMLAVSAWLFRHAAGSARSGWRAVLLLGLAAVVLGEGLVFLIKDMAHFSNLYGSYANSDLRFASASGFLVLALFVGGIILGLLLRKVTPSPKPVRWLQEILWSGIGGALAALAGLTFDFHSSSFDYDKPAAIGQSDIPIVHFTYFAGLMISGLALFFGIRWLWCHAPERARPC